MKTLLILLALCRCLCLLWAKPSRVPMFAPYIYPELVAQQIRYGLKALTLAFVLARNGCHPSWLVGQKDINDPEIIWNIRIFKAAGGQLIVSLGGADGEYLENHCHSVTSLANVYRRVLTVTNTTHLDLDIENFVPVDNMTMAVAKIQRENPAITFSLTIACNESGIQGQGSKGMDILRSAVKNGVNVDIVNIMTMDFLSNKTWGDVIPIVGTAALKQLKQIWPHKSNQELYSMIGLTPMIGRNDQGNIFREIGAHKTVAYVKRKGLGHVAFWAVGRDNGNCPNEQGKPGDVCSGIRQSDHEFTKIFKQVAN